MSARVLRWLPLPILGVGVLAAWGLARGRPAVPETPPAPAALRVTVVEAHLGEHRVRVRAHGSVEPRTEIDLVAEVPGRVAALSPSLAAGGFFEADEVLIELDPEDARLALERAEATLLRTASERRLAAARLERLRSLAANEVASAAQIEDAEHAWQIASAALREARAGRDQARRDLDRTRIRAPFAGRVRSEHVGIGQFVPRGTALARIQAVDHAEVRLPIPSSELAHLDLPLSGGRVSPPGPVVQLRARFAGSDATWTGHIARVEGEIAPRSRMLHVVARVDDPYGLRSPSTRAPLTAGLFVEAEIEGRSLPTVAVVPRAALRGRNELLVVDASGHARSRRVEVVRLDGDEVVVSGLENGARVVASALGVLDGNRVTIAPDRDVSARPHAELAP